MSHRLQPALAHSPRARRRGALDTPRDRSEAIEASIHFTVEGLGLLRERRLRCRAIRAVDPRPRRRMNDEVVVRHHRVVLAERLDQHGLGEVIPTLGGNMRRTQVIVRGDRRVDQRLARRDRFLESPGDLGTGHALQLHGPDAIGLSTAVRSPGAAGDPAGVRVRPSAGSVVGGGDVEVDVTDAAPPVHVRVGAVEVSVAGDHRQQQLDEARGPCR